MPPRTKRGFAALVATVVSFTLAPVASAASLSRAELSILTLVNRFRTDHDLPRLAVDARLERAARAHSRDMIRHQYFAHGAFAARIRSFGVRGSIVGENLAWGYGSSAEAHSVMSMWLHSPEHRANLLRPGFRRIGLGAPVGPFAGYRYARVVTADFAG